MENQSLSVLIGQEVSLILRLIRQFRVLGAHTICKHMFSFSWLSIQEGLEVHYLQRITMKINPLRKNGYIRYRDLYLLDSFEQIGKQLIERCRCNSFNRVFHR